MTDEYVLDVTGLEPPEPLQHALSAAEALLPGRYIRLKINRDPLLLYPMLRVQGFSYDTRAGTSSRLEVFIWRANDKEAESGVRDSQDLSK